MPLLDGPVYTVPSPAAGVGHHPNRRQSQHSDIAIAAMMINSANHSPSSDDMSMTEHDLLHKPSSSMLPPAKPLPARSSGSFLAPSQKPPFAFLHQHHHSTNGVGPALTDTPATTAPNSPQINPPSAASGASTPAKNRATTLDIPGLTKSRVSPDGRIADRDIGAKLVIIMVGLPARGKSYIVKKIARYLNWLQHPTEIFNVGERRRVAAGGGQTIPQTTTETKLRESIRRLSTSTPNGIVDQRGMLPPPMLSGHFVVNGEPEEMESPQQEVKPIRLPPPAQMDQSADFFDPANLKAFKLREQVALESLDELLDYVLVGGGSVGILDATNSTLERRKLLMSHIRERAGSELGVLFLESRCIDENLLESNMRLKLSGPDYKDYEDPVAALADFKKRVKMYEKTYVPLGDYEEKHKMPYVQMIDVGRKLITHQIRGFLSVQAVTYLMNFNLAPRQIWLTRHGESIDNALGRIGGDSALSPNGVRYAQTLTRFIIGERAAWEAKQLSKQASTHWPPQPGDTTPPNPEYTSQIEGTRNFCVWTSMLKRSIDTSQFFDEEEFDLKQMRMLDELNSGEMEGMTYEEIRTKRSGEYELRKRDKLLYRYPGPGGEGYLDIINRLQKVIVEVERMTDHVLLIVHRSIARVLLAYFKGLRREEISDLDVPLGVLYMLEPKPYGVDFRAYRYNPLTDWFDYDPDFQMRRADNPNAL